MAVSQRLHDACGSRVHPVIAQTGLPVPPMLQGIIANGIVLCLGEGMQFGHRFSFQDGGREVRVRRRPDLNLADAPRRGLDEIWRDEEHRRNEHSDGRRPGFREFSTRRRGKQGSRRSLSVAARRGGGTDCPRGSAPCSVEGGSLPQAPADTEDVGISWQDFDILALS